MSYDNCPDCKDYQRKEWTRQKLCSLHDAYAHQLCEQIQLLKKEKELLVEEIRLLKEAPDAKPVAAGGTGT